MQIFKAAVTCVTTCLSDVTNHDYYLFIITKKGIIIVTFAEPHMYVIVFESHVIVIVIDQRILN